MVHSNFKDQGPKLSERQVGKIFLYFYLMQNIIRRATQRNIDFDADFSLTLVFRFLKPQIMMMKFSHPLPDPLQQLNNKKFHTKKHVRYLD